MIIENGEMAYRLGLPPNSNVHPVFHVSKLKKFVGLSANIFPAALLTNSHGAIRSETKAILQRRITTRDNRPFIELLVKWRSSEEDSS